MKIQSKNISNIFSVTVYGDIWMIFYIGITCILVCLCGIVVTFLGRYSLFICSYMCVCAFRGYPQCLTLSGCEKPDGILYGTYQSTCSELVHFDVPFHIYLLFCYISVYMCVCPRIRVRTVHFILFNVFSLFCHLCYSEK